MRHMTAQATGSITSPWPPPGDHSPGHMRPDARRSLCDGAFSGGPIRATKLKTVPGNTAGRCVQGGRGSDPYKAAVVDDRCKDPSGRSLNILTALMSVVNVEFTPRCRQILSGDPENTVHLSPPWRPESPLFERNGMDFQSLKFL